MQPPTFRDIFATWVPQYEWRGRSYLITNESLATGLEIAARAHEADRIWMEAKRQVSIVAAKTIVKAGSPKEAKRVALTVCPDSGDHTTMLQIAHIVSTVSAVDGGKYVVEQRSKPGEDPYGWHLHFYIETKYAPAKIKQFVQQKLASRGYTCTYYATKADENWVTKYMSGLKGNSEKDQKVEQDKILRKKYGIPDIIDLKASETT